MYEEFLSKVSILGKSVYVCVDYRVCSSTPFVCFCIFKEAETWPCFHLPTQLHIILQQQVRESRVQHTVYCRLARINTGASCHTKPIAVFV